MDTELRLLTDYLINRKQYVRFNKYNSDNTNILPAFHKGQSWDQSLVF